MVDTGWERMAFEGNTEFCSRSRNAGTGGDRNMAVRAWFGEAGFSEIGYHTRGRR